jgi:hypothetical protein
VISEKTRMNKIWSNVQASSAEGCWTWNGSRNNAGYGQVTINYRNKRAHRFFYEMLIGNIPENKVIDHTCRNKSCVNPAHMEIVTVGENSRRGQSRLMEAHRNNTCANGHKWNRLNLRVRPQKDGTAKICCRICQNDTQKTRRSRAKQ